MNLKALYNGVIVKPVETDEQQYGSIVVPDLGKEKNTLGRVVAVGTGHYTITGELIPTQLKTGQKVILPTMGFTRFDYQGDEYFIGKENEVLGLIDEKVDVKEVLKETKINMDDIENLKIKGGINE